MGWNPIKTVKNLVKNPGKEIGNAWNNQTSWTTGGWKDAANAFVGKAPNAPSPGEDPNVTALRNRLFGEAQNFERDLPGLRASEMGQVEKEGNQALEQGLKGTRQNFNRRGLLYSGLREAGEQGVRGRVASEMANQKTQVNSDLNKMSAAKYNTAAQVGLQGYQQAVDREAQIADIKLQNQVARAQAYQQIGAIGGQAIGSYYGSRQPGSSPTASPGYAGSWTNYSNEFGNGNLAYDTNRMYA